MKSAELGSDAFPKRIPLQLSRLVAEPPDGPGWLHEIKHDGYRAATEHEVNVIENLTEPLKRTYTQIPHGPVYESLAPESTRSISCDLYTRLPILLATNASRDALRLLLPDRWLAN